ncbi:MAG: ParB N-terminal domain-containing protein [Aliishimia sp.]
MVKKRSVFDIDFEPEDTPTAAPSGPLETKAFRNVQGHPMQNAYVSPDEMTPERRGPMASAIAETAEANADRAATEASIRAENDALAHEHVRLKKLGLITDLIATQDVHSTKLTRDRSQNADPELDELKASIQSVGLSNPIRVEKTGQGYELIQGFRRLNAFRELAEETGDPRYTRIPAALVPRGEPLVDLYRKMVDENLVRKDLSFGEMAQLAVSYAQDSGIPVQKAVKELYASALKQKRSYIQSFASLITRLNGTLRFPEALPRALGLELNKAMDADADFEARIIQLFETHPNRTAQTEPDILRVCLASKDADKARPVKALQKTVSKTSLRLLRPEGEAKVVASDGKVELRLDRDFSAVSKADLQKGIEALLKALDGAD